MSKSVEQKTKSNKTRRIVGCGVLTAVAVVLQYIEISIPIVPSFIKLDFSDLPELIGAFAYGPVVGVLIALLKNLIHMAVSQSGFVGELSNFILGAVFAGVAGLIKKEHVINAGKDCVVIDVGINFKDGKMCGDVAFDEVEPLVSQITPVPGGVGGVTSVVMAEHVVRAAVKASQK